MPSSNPRLDPRSVLLVDDDDLFRDATSTILRSRGYTVETAGSLRDAERHQPSRFDCVVVDHQLPDGSGLTLASQLAPSPARVVVVSANPRVEAAIEALRLGLAGFLPKPLDIESLVSALALAPSTAIRDRRRSTAAPQLPPLLPSLASQADYLSALAASRCPVIVLGETGSGKGELARTIHALGRRTGTMISVNCAAIPSNLAEAELFGVERGAFTGAESRPGLLELADEGTLFLDEIGDLNLATQAKLLSFLDDGNVRRVGGTTWKSVSVRIIAATNVDLDRASSEGSFRSDLLHRLQVARVELSPLRERSEDLEPLVEVILEKLRRRDELDYRIADGQLAALARHDWPGNVRELANALERSTLSCPPSELEPARFVGSQRPLATIKLREGGAPGSSGVSGSSSVTGDVSLERVEREHILRILELCDGNRTLAASKLRIGVATLRRKLADWSVA